MAKFSSILSAVKGLIITVVANSTPSREPPSPAHIALSTPPPIKACSPSVCFSWASEKKQKTKKKWVSPNPNLLTVLN